MSVTAALAQLRQGRHISISAIKAYLQCPRQYAHRYVFNTPPTHRPGALSFGVALHEALADHYRALAAGTEAPLAELQDIFAASWARELVRPVPVLLDDGETGDGLQAKGLELLSVFYAQAPRPHQVVAVEEPFSLELTDPATGAALPARLVGVFDLVVAENDGSHTVVEHKSAARRWDSNKVDHDLQLSSYSLAARMLGYGDARLTVQALLKARKPALELYHPQRTAQDRRDFVEVAAGVIRAIDAGALHPLRDWHCKGCGFAGPCMTG